MYAPSHCMLYAVVGVSSAAVVLDDKYVKAYSRRGLVRFKRGKYLEVRSFEAPYLR